MPCTPGGCYTALRPLTGAANTNEGRVSSFAKIDEGLRLGVAWRYAGPRSRRLPHTPAAGRAEGSGSTANELVDKPPPPDIPTGPSPPVRRVATVVASIAAARHRRRRPPSPPPPAIAAAASRSLNELARAGVRATCWGSSAGELWCRSRARATRRAVAAAQLVCWRRSSCFSHLIISGGSDKIRQ